MGKKAVECCPTVQLLSLPRCFIPFSRKPVPDHSGALTHPGELTAGQKPITHTTEIPEKEQGHSPRSPLSHLQPLLAQSLRWSHPSRAEAPIPMLSFMDTCPFTEGYPAAPAPSQYVNTGLPSWVHSQPTQSHIGLFLSLFTTL